MRPKPVEQLHLVFRSQIPAGIPNIPASGEASTKQDVQRIAKMLTANLYFVQVIGEIQENLSANVEDVEMSGDEAGEKKGRSISWRFEFKDTPDPGKQAVSGRLMSRTPIEDGDIVEFMKSFGYE